MSYVIGKRMIAHPPRYEPQAGSLPFMTGGLVKAGSILTLSTGIWNGQGSANPRVQWWLGTRTAYASATNFSYSLSAGDAGSGLTAVLSMGNATWGTNVRQVAAAGTILA